MTGWPGRGPLGLCLRRSLAVAAWPTLAAALLGLLAHHLRPLQLGGGEAPGAASPWLVLPLATAMLLCAVAGATFWPGFAQRRPGRDWIDRVQRGRSAGVPAAIGGVLLAQLLLTLPLATGLALALGAPLQARGHFDLLPPGDPVLDAQRPTLAFAVATRAPCAELLLRPLAGLPTGDGLGIDLEVRGDGEPLGTARLVHTRQLVRLSFPPRTISRLSLHHRGGSLPLLFVPGSATLVGAEPVPALGNGALLALVTLVPTFVALALAALAGLGAGLPTVLAVVASLWFVQTIGGIGPFDGTVLAHLRGQWPGAAAAFQATAPSLAVGGLAMILAMFLRPRARR